MNTTAALASGSPTSTPVIRTRHDDRTAVRAAVHSEWIKLRSLRSTPAVIGLTVVVGVLLSWILAAFVKTDPNTHKAFTIAQTFVFSTWLTTLLAIVMGTLLFTSEVQHRTLTSTVAAQPARWVAVAAKAVVGSCLGLVMGAVGMVAGFAGAELGGLHTGDTSGVAVSALWALLLTTLAPVLGLGVGMIVRHSAAAASIVLVWALVVENLVKGFASPAVSRLLPFSAATGLLGIRSAGDTTATMTAAFSRSTDAVQFAGYCIVVLAAGTVLLHRRDPH